MDLRKLRPDTSPSAAPLAGAPFEIAGRQVHPQRNDVVVGDERRRLEARHMKVLLRLARGAGEAVTREALLDAGWGARAVGDDSLTQAISRLRRALDDGRGGDSLIETLPKVGYRLTCAPGPASSRVPVRAPAFARPVRAAAAWAGAHVRTAVAASAVLLFAAAFGWRASELAFSVPPASSGAVQEGAVQEGPASGAAEPERKIIIYRTFTRPGGAPDSGAPLPPT